jgi:hypothetical protein
MKNAQSALREGGADANAFFIALPDRDFKTSSVIRLARTVLSREIRPGKSLDVLV